MSEEKKKADLAEELKRLNDTLESDRGGALPELNNILDCGGISAIKNIDPSPGGAHRRDAQDAPRYVRTYRRNA